MVKTELENWAKKIDKYTYIPEDMDNKFLSLREWLQSEECYEELNSFTMDFVEESNLITGEDVKIISIENITEHSSDDNLTYDIEATIQVEYRIDDNISYIKDYNVNIEVISIIDDLLHIDNVYLIENQSRYE